MWSIRQEVRQSGFDASSSNPCVFVRRPLWSELPDAPYELPLTGSTAEGAIRMTPLARLKPLGAVATILIRAIAGVVAQERQQPASKGGTVKAPPLDEDVLPPFDAGAADLAANRDLARRQLAVI